MCAARSACLWLCVVASHHGRVRAKPLLLEHMPDSPKPKDFQCDTIDPLTCRTGCANGTTCFMKKDYKRSRTYSACCCNESIKEVEKLHIWSCYVAYKSKPAQTHGTAPFCAIHCCKRPLVSRACHGNDPLCCDANVSQCGIDAHGGSCCALLKGNTQQCSHLLGRTCGWMRTSWLTFLMPTRRCPFVVDGLGGCFWTCEGVSSELLVTGLFMVSGSWALHSRFKLDALAARRAKRQRVLWLVLIAVLIFCVALWARHEWPMCLLWTGMCLAVALLPVLCWHLQAYRRDRCRWQHVRHRSRSTASAEGNKRLAILINQERYEGGLAPLYDNCIEPLRAALVDSGWETSLVWKDMRRADFMPLVRNITGNLEGTSHAQVLICISCHSQMVGGTPHILPVDAGSCSQDGVSIYEILRQLGRARAHRPHFAVLVNGCLDSAGCLQQLFGCARPVRLADSVVPRVGEAIFSVLWACDPGRTAHGEWFTKKLCEFLARETRENVSLESFFAFVQERDRPEEGLAQFPYVMITGRFSDFLLKVVRSSSMLSTRGGSRISQASGSLTS